MSKIKFSFVIPVYNVKECLEKCVNSVIHQDYDLDLIEIVLVDDGSKDGSEKLCDDLAEMYPLLKVIHKLNGGLSDARNVGMTYASGDYIVFLDSDDYIEPNSCSEFEKKIVSCTTMPDIVTGATCRRTHDKEEQLLRKCTSDNLIRGIDYLKYELKGNIFVTAWSSIYRRDFLNLNNLQFKKGFLHEDEDFTPRAFLCAEKVLCTNIVFYNYIIREGSITTAANKIKNAKCIFEISRDLMSVYENITDQELKELLYTHTAKICYKAMVDARLDKADNRSIVDKSLLKKTSIKKKEKIRYILWNISPRLFNFIYTISK